MYCSNACICSASDHCSQPGSSHGTGAVVPARLSSRRTRLSNAFIGGTPRVSYPRVSGAPTRQGLVWSSALSLGGITRDIVAPEDNHHPLNALGLMAFDLKRILGSFAVIPMHEKAWPNLPRLREGLQQGNPPGESVHAAPPLTCGPARFRGR